MSSKLNELPTVPCYGELWLLRNSERIKELSKDYRPVLIISDNERNKYDKSVVALPLTTDDLDDILIVEVFIQNTPETGLDKPSKILCDSPFTWEKGLRFKKKLGVVSPEMMERVKKTFKVAFNL